MANDELYTPKHIFDALNLNFDLDVCAPKNGPMFVPASKWFSLENDGLSQEWSGKVWMNPPFSGPGPWIDKWLDHKNGLALVCFSKAKWFKKLWSSEAVCVANPGTMTFVTPEGKNYGIAFPTAIWAIGETNITALKMSGLGRIR